MRLLVSISLFAICLAWIGCVDAHAGHHDYQEKNDGICRNSAKYQSSCRGWADRGFCKGKYGRFMQRYCKKSCALCPDKSCKPDFSKHNIENGAVSCSDGNNLKSICEFSCDDGYYVEGTPKHSCEPEGWTYHMNWEGERHAPAPVCKKKNCFPDYSSASSGGISNGEVSCSDGDNSGSVCSFTCNDGYSLQGSQTVTCSNTWLYDNFGPWDNSEPFCKKDDEIDVAGCDGSGYEYNGYTYDMSPQLMETWNEARTYCRLRGGDLAHHNMGDQNGRRDIAFAITDREMGSNKMIYFGLHRVGWQWQWLDGTVATEEAINFMQNHPYIKKPEDLQNTFFAGKDYNIGIFYSMEDSWSDLQAASCIQRCGTYRAMCEYKC